MKRTLTAVALLAALSPNAFAAIAGPVDRNGNGEVFLVIQNTANQVSYSFDTGLGLEDFFANGNNPSFLQTFNIGADPIFQQFVTQISSNSSLGQSSWAVMAFDAVGNTQPGNQRLLTTARQLATPEATNEVLASWTNANFSLGVTQVAPRQWFAAVNQTGTHANPPPLPLNPVNFDINGSSINSALDTNPFGYFGQTGGLTPTLQGNAPFLVTNPVTATSSSPFYYFTRSSTSNLASARVLVSGFQDPDSGFRGTWYFDGQTLVYAVPEPSTYAMLGAGLLALGAWVRRRKSR